MREFYPDLQGLKHDDPLLLKTLKLGKRCYDQSLKDENEITVPAAKSKYHHPGGFFFFFFFLIGIYYMKG